ncbi:AAA family ATPase [bacterium]|nr:AAA family ATPase [bacterium]
MPAAQLRFVTGKGGVGKTTVAAALAVRLAARGQRVLLVETAADRSLAAAFGTGELTAEPLVIEGTLSAVRIEQRALVESYFRRLLRLPFLARRLFASATFQAVAAAAPGVIEFVVLEHLLHWTEPGRFSRRAAYDAVIVDGPASGHAVRWLRTPRQLGRLVPAGPIASSIGRLQALLEDARRTRVVLVAIPDEMAVAELLETRRALAPLGVALAAPVLNRVWRKRFNAAEAAAIAARAADDPLVAAARLAIAARREAEQHLARLRRETGTAPIALPERPAAAIDAAALAAFGRALAPLAEDADGA